MSILETCNLLSFSEIIGSVSDFIEQYGTMLLTGIGDTLYMTLLSTLLSYAIGLPVGIVLYITAKNGMIPHPKLNAVLGAIVNILRSIPFIILILFLVPFTRAIVGTVIGPSSAVVALVVAASPFVARLVESSMAEINTGVIEAAKTMGATNWQIIYKVLVPESIPSLIRGSSIATITIIGYSAMAGAVGAGGLGDIAIRYGYHRYDGSMMFVTIILLIIIVQGIQAIFNVIAKKIDKRNIK